MRLYAKGHADANVQCYVALKTIESAGMLFSRKYLAEFISIALVDIVPEAVNR